MVKLLPILKHVLNINSQKSFTGLWMYLKVTHGLRFHLFIFFFLGAGLLLSFHGHSCPWIMIICIQPQTWGASWCGCRNGASLFFLSNWDGAPLGVGALRKLHTLGAAVLTVVLFPLSDKLISMVFTLIVDLINLLSCNENKSFFFFNKIDLFISRWRSVCWKVLAK